MSDHMRAMAAANFQHPCSRRQKNKSASACAACSAVKGKPAATIHQPHVDCDEARASSAICS
ncbi:hypothetical protein KCP78_08340 [Salmonella enterica subsp. enterica]|nr:hypothetical protein KCP78_08340 [Salmonella enterica subsp. enterica]